MKAIILAAGMGTRLRKYTKNLPKGMLKFNGKSLIAHQIDTLRACGIKDIIIVKGYQSNKIRFKGITYYTNKLYRDTNMVETLMAAEKELKGDVLVCYADILYEKSIIKKIMADTSNIGVAVDDDYWDYWTARLHNPESDIESLVIKNNLIVELGNPCKKKNAKYRYIGLIKFSRKGIFILKSVYHKHKTLYYASTKPWFDSPSFRKAFLTSLLSAIIQEGNTVKPIIVHRGWLEFDTVEDYEKAMQWLREKTIDRFINLV